MLIQCSQWQQRRISDCHASTTTALWPFAPSVSEDRLELTLSLSFAVMAIIKNAGSFSSSNMIRASASLPCVIEYCKSLTALLGKCLWDSINNVYPRQLELWLTPLQERLDGLDNDFVVLLVRRRSCAYPCVLYCELDQCVYLGRWDVWLALGDAVDFLFKVCNGGHNNELDVFKQIDNKVWANLLIIVFWVDKLCKFNIFHWQTIAIMRSQCYLHRIVHIGPPWNHAFNLYLLWMVINLFSFQCNLAHKTPGFYKVFKDEFLCDCVSAWYLAPLTSMDEWIQVFNSLIWRELDECFEWSLRSDWHVTRQWSVINHLTFFYTFYSHTSVFNIRNSIFTFQVSSKHAPFYSRSHCFQRHFLALANHSNMPRSFNVKQCWSSSRLSRNIRHWNTRPILSSITPYECHFILKVQSVE